MHDERGALDTCRAEGEGMLITAERLFNGLTDSIVEDPLIEVLDGKIVWDLRWSR